tara:strand:- start:813 stop:2195 length:1383 start_codon:yes stop_codon:yes gene_type:complete
MSSGGRVQLAAVGAQDVYLTSNPQMSYFLKTYARHSKFAMQTIEIPFQEAPTFGRSHRATISRIGDLVREIYLKFELPELDQGIVKQVVGGVQSTVDTYPGYCDSIGHAIIKQATMKIGGQTVETINGDYLDIYEEMFVPVSQNLAIQELVGRTYNRTGLGPASNVVYRTEQGFSATGSFPRTFLVPLRFYFTQDPNLAVPMTAISRQEMTVDIRFEDIQKLIVNTQVSESTDNILDNITTNLQLGGTPVKLTNASLLVDYIFISDEESKFFESKSLDYLATQIQGAETRVLKTENFTKFPKQIRSHFNNPVKEMYITVQSDNFRPHIISDIDTTVTDYFRYTSSITATPDNLTKMELLFNGHPRLLSSVADSFYLRAVQPLQAHTRTPRRYIYNYSFSIDPENYQPTGQVNMSRIENCLFNMYLSEASDANRTIRIYVKSYNVLRVETGLAGLLFNFNG